MKLPTIEETNVAIRKAKIFDQIVAIIEADDYDEVLMSQIITLLKANGYLGGEQ